MPFNRTKSTLSHYVAIYYYHDEYPLLVSQESSIICLIPFQQNVISDFTLKEVLIFWL